MRILKDADMGRRAYDLGGGGDVYWGGVLAKLGRAADPLAPAG